jgi:hypothetical protein
MFNTKGVRLTAGAVTFAMAAAMPANSAEFVDGRIKADFYMMTGWQALGADPGAFKPENENPSSGAQRIRFNAEFTFRFNDWITGFIDIGEEPNDFGDSNAFSIQNDLAFIDFSLLKAFNSASSPDNTLVLRLGEPVTTTFNYRGFSDGAAVQSNPLIGNSPFDIVTAESGAQLLGEHGRFGWDVAFTVPTFGENFAPDRGYDITGRARFNVGGGFKLGAGVLVTDGEQQWETNQVGGVADDSTLSTTEALFGDNENYNFPGSGVSDRTTHQGLVPGVNANVWMIDAEWEPTVIPGSLLRGWYGVAADDFRFVTAAGGPQTVRAVSTLIQRGDSEVAGFGLEGTYYILPSKFYLAGRYTLVSNESAGVVGSPELDRIQVGAGWWLHSTTLAKLEYVAQKEELNSAGQIGSNWDGVALEVSAKF